MIEFEKVTAGYGQDFQVRGVSLFVPEGSLTALIGPNGCGKTTLLRAAARLLPLQAGCIRVAGRAVSDYDRREFARAAAFLPQVRAVPEITVRALVSHGRFPYLGFSRTLTREDRARVDWAMEQTRIQDWCDRDLRQLSGGERQRVYIAMALAQDTRAIFLDEPTAYLDLRHQFELMELVRSLARMGKTMVLVLHDLAHALTYCDQVALMRQGALVCAGAPEQVYGCGALEDVFGVRIARTPEGYCISARP